MFSGIKTWLIAGAAIFLLISAVVVFFKYTETQKQKLIDEISLLKANEAKYVLAISEQTKTIDFLEAQQERIRANYLQAQEAFVTTRRENAELQQRLLALNLGKSALVSPSATEIAINDLQRNLNRCFELESGALLTEKESLAKTAEELNPECPWIFTERNK